MISIIVAVSENNVIGQNNKIPWYLPRDLKYFASTTKGHKVVMGRNTYQSIVDRLGKPLPERANIIITKNKDFLAPGCVIINEADEFIKKIAETEEEVFVIGGEQLYKLALPRAKRLYQTVVHTQIVGDAFFPALDMAEWHLVKSEHFTKDEKNNLDSTCNIYERK